ELTSFLAAGEPPVYVGFGSMTGNDPERLTTIALEALRLSGRRGVLLSGWAGLAAGDLPESVLKLDAVPHDWLFPRMAAVVHHGGVGTTHVGLRAGVPNIVVPFFGDQPFWGDRVHALGAGPRPIVLEELTAERLAESIGLATSDAAMRARAAEVGRLIQADSSFRRHVVTIRFALRVPMPLPCLIVSSVDTQAIQDQRITDDALLNVSIDLNEALSIDVKT
ncbi:MAG: hypothetical protein DCC51_14575, partial [Anaerolineae bacterium]